MITNIKRSDGNVVPFCTSKIVNYMRTKIPANQRDPKKLYEVFMKALKDIFTTYSNNNGSITTTEIKHFTDLHLECNYTIKTAKKA